jgi:pimeloyl-ACP methyl ester carboxylesterase
MPSKPRPDPASGPRAGPPRVAPESRIPCGVESRVPIRIPSAAALLLLVLLATDQRSQAAASRRITLRTEDGVSLAGTYIESSRHPSPGIVLLHMLTRTHEDWLAAGSRLADAGFAVLAFDFRNLGDAGQDALELDVKAAKAFLRERPEVEPGAMGIAGASIGANIAVIDAADDPGVRSIALVSPGLDYRNLRTEAPMKKFGARPALLVASTKDPYAWHSVRALAAIGPGTREVRLSDVLAHGTVLLSKDQDLAGALVDWFRRTLL